MAQPEEVGRGTVLAGRYELGSVLGKGGMGVVFRGRHLGTDRPIAVKILRREFASDPTLAKRFVREAKAAAALRHPNVVDVLDYGVDGDGTAYQVLELLEGESLREHLERKGKISLDTTLGLLFPVIHALAMAHSRGVIHRDLKPDNVFLARNVHGRIVPKLLDFGIAKVMPKDGTSATLSTRVGAVMGTPAYMSPEQARGTPDVGTATDIWAIGVILFECLAGRIPFEAETASMLMARIMMEHAPSLATVAPETPATIVGCIDRALAPKSDARWPSMEVFAEALRDAAVACGATVPAVGASDAAPMTLPPPRLETDDSGEGPAHTGDSSGDDIDIEIDSATRVNRGARRRERVQTGAATQGAGTPPAAAAQALERGTADTDRPPPGHSTAPRGKTKAGHAELGFIATAPGLSVSASAVAPPEVLPVAPRVPLVPVLAVSVLVALVIGVGVWMSGSSDASTAEVVPPPTVAQPVVVPPSTPTPPPLPVDAPDFIVDPGFPVGIDPVVETPPPRVDRHPPRVPPSSARGPRTDTAHTTTTPPDEPPDEPRTPRGHGLPGLSEW